MRERFTSHSSRETRARWMGHPGGGEGWAEESGRPDGSIPHPFSKGAERMGHPDFVVLLFVGVVGWGPGGFVPELRAAPGAGGGEVEVDGELGQGLGRGGIEELVQAVAELGDCVAEGEEAGGDGVAGEVEGVAGAVEVAFEGCGEFAVEGEFDGEEIEACLVAGRAGPGCGGAVVTGGRRGGRGGAEDEVAEGDGVGAEGGELEGFAGEGEIAEPGWGGLG